MTQTNIGSGRGKAKLKRACQPACKPGGLNAAKNALFMPGQPVGTSGYFSVTKDPITLTAYGLCDGDELVLEQIELEAGCPPMRHGCCLRMEGDSRVAFVQPFLANCQPVTLSECQTRIVVDQVGTYRLKLIPGEGNDSPCSLGELLVKQSKETVAGTITDSMRGFCPPEPGLFGTTDSSAGFAQLLSVLGCMNDAQRNVVKSMLDLNIDADAIACALVSNETAFKTLSDGPLCSSDS